MITLQTVVPFFFVPFSNEQGNMLCPITLYHVHISYNINIIIPTGIRWVPWLGRKEKKKNSGPTAVARFDTVCLSGLWCNRLKNSHPPTPPIPSICWVGRRSNSRSPKPQYIFWNEFGGSTAADRDVQGVALWYYLGVLQRLQRICTPLNVEAALVYYVLRLTSHKIEPFP